MLPLYEKIEHLCQGENINITEMCRRANVPRSALSDYKAGRKKTISLINLEKIADLFNITLDELTGRNTTEKENTPTLTEKDRRDVALDVERIMGNLAESDSLMFDGVPMSEEARASMAAAMRIGLEEARRRNKETYTPRRYRKE